MYRPEIRKFTMEVEKVGWGWRYEKKFMVIHSLYDLVCTLNVIGTLHDN